jgi:glycosyltransferase involved in cell wall biosynthesis
MEFMAVGVPVVVSSTAVDRHYFDDRVVRFFPSGDAVAMADAMHEVLTNEALRTSLVAAGIQYVERNNWEHSRERYLAIVDALCAGVAATTGVEVSDGRES